MSTSVAIIGGGQGGASVAQALRNRGYAGGIHLFSAEDVLPYERPPLSKGMLCGGGDAPTWVLPPEEFYDTQRIELHLGSKVTDVRSAGVRHMVVVDGAPVLEVDEVVLATGSVPRALRIPGTELRGVHALSCVADLGGALLDDLGGAARRVVIGGEAGSLAQRSLPDWWRREWRSSWSIPSPHPWQPGRPRGSRTGLSSVTGRPACAV